MGNQKPRQHEENANTKILNWRKERITEAIDFEECDRMKDANQCRGENA